MFLVISMFKDVLGLEWSGLLLPLLLHPLLLLLNPSSRVGQSLPLRDPSSRLGELLCVLEADTGREKHHSHLGLLSYHNCWAMEQT